MRTMNRSSLLSVSFYLAILAGCGNPGNPMMNDDGTSTMTGTDGGMKASEDMTTMKGNTPDMTEGTKPDMTEGKLDPCSPNVPGGMNIECVPYTDEGLKTDCLGMVCGNQWLSNGFVMTLSCSTDPNGFVATDLSRAANISAGAWTPITQASMNCQTMPGPALEILYGWGQSGVEHGIACVAASCKSMVIEMYDANDKMISTIDLTKR